MKIPAKYADEIPFAGQLHSGYMILNQLASIKEAGIGPDQPVSPRP